MEFEARWAKTASFPIRARSIVTYLYIDIPSGVQMEVAALHEDIAEGLVGSVRSVVPNIRSFSRMRCQGPALLMRSDSDPHAKESSLNLVVAIIY